MTVVYLSIQSVVTFCGFRNVKVNIITKFYPFKVFGNHMPEKYDQWQLTGLGSQYLRLKNK